MNDPLHNILFAKSIAVIGASNDPKKRGYQAIKQLIVDKYPGAIYPINPKQTKILGLKVYSSILDIKATIDTALVCTPARTLPSILAQCGKKDIAGVIVLAAGFAEIGSEGEALGRMVLKAARDNNIRIIGPNTNGVFNLQNKMNLAGVQGVEPGNIGIISQSGNMSLAFITEAKRRGGLGFSSYVGVGNQLDVGLNEYLEYFGEDDSTQVPLFYIEGFKNGREFLETCRKVTQKKPVVIYKAGRTAAGQATAISHTGSLASHFALTRGVLQQAGATVIERTDQALSVAEGLAKMPVTKGGNVAVLADGGGHATIVIDALVEKGVDLAEMSDDTYAKLSKILPPTAAIRNPVDVAGGTDDNPYVFADCVEVILGDDHVDILIIVGMFGGYSTRFSKDLLNAEIETAIKIGALSHNFNKPIVVQSLYGTLRPEPLKELTKSGVPLFIWIEPAVCCVVEAIKYAKASMRIANSVRVEPREPSNIASRIVAHAYIDKRSALFEHEAKDLLKAYGVAIPPYQLVRTSTELKNAIEKLGDVPVAMKIVSADIQHKSDADCVELNVFGQISQEKSFNALIANANAYKPDANIQGVLISPMASAGIEVIIGVICDQTFGPVMMFGLGGVFVEVFKDVSFRALPMSRADAFEMVSEIKSTTILDGVRGDDPIDKEALVDLIMQVASLALAHPEIVEIDINPVIMRNDGYDIVDARMILSNSKDL